jgi:hypothetical protein
VKVTGPPSLGALKYICDCVKINKKIKINIKIVLLIKLKGGMG